MSKQFQEPRSVSTDGSVDLREFLQKVAHRKWLVLAVVVLVTGLAAGYSYSRPKVFSATSKVLVRPTLIQPGDTDPFDNISMATEAQLVASTDVARIAWETLGSSGRIVDLIDRVSVTTPESTQILQITFTDRSADGARAGAQAFAQAYLEFKAEQATDEIAANAATVQTLIDDVGGDILTLDARIQDLTQESPEWAIAKSDRRSAEARRSGLLDSAHDDHHVQHRPRRGGAAGGATVGADQPEAPVRTSRSASSWGSRPVSPSPRCVSSCKTASRARPLSGRS